MKTKIRIDELKSTGRLPSPTGVALEILELTKEDDVPIQELSKTIHKDPALSGRLLKYANSSFAGFKNPTFSIEKAIVRLGITTVTKLALSFSLLSNSRNGKSKLFDYSIFWSSSLATAILSHMLSRENKLLNPDEAFTCGLLCSIGQLAFTTLHPEKYDALLKRHQENSQLSLVELEHTNFSMTHNDLTAALLEDWQLPESPIHAIYYSEKPEESPLEPDSQEFKLARMFQFASKTAHLFTADEEKQVRLVPEINALLTENGLTETTMPDFWEEGLQQWNEWGKIFEIATPAVPSWEQVLENAEQQAEASRKQGQKKEKNESPPSPASDNATGDVEPEDQSQIDHQTQIPSPACGSENDTSEPPVQKGDPIRILAVEDDKSQLTILSSLLKHYGHEVFTATNGKEGLDQVLKHYPQIVITDWLMPEMDGIELCRTLRRAEDTRQIYVIVLTSCESEDDIVKAFDNGADDYVVKPFQPRTLVARVRAAERVVKLQKENDRDKKKIQAYLSEMSVLNRKLEQLALTDLLTVLPNRRYAMKILKQEWAFATRKKLPLSCLILDVDHFKNVNDTYGHDVGDLVLKQIAATISKSIRTSDVVCRYGGEEFLILCKSTTLDGAELVGNRIRKQIEQTIIQSNKQCIRATVSIGVAERTDATTGFHAMLKKADQALYQAKNSGRNRVCCFRPEREKEQIIRQ